jgi:hypothetical protein
MVYVLFISAVKFLPVANNSANAKRSEIFIPHSKKPVNFLNKINALIGIFVIFAVCPDNLSHNSIISSEFHALFPTSGLTLSLF